MVGALMKMKHFEKIRISPIIITNFEQCFGTSWSGWIAYGLASKLSLISGPAASAWKV